MMFNLDGMEWHAFIVESYDLSEPLVLEFRSFGPKAKDPSNVLRLQPRINSPWKTLNDLNLYAQRVQKYMRANGGIFPDFGSEEWR